MERWLPIGGFEGLYEVSDEGRVRRVAPGANTFPGRILTGYTRPDWYPTVLLVRGGKTYTRNIHRLVAIAFLGPPSPGMQVNHRDGDKTNNRLSNLEWTTPSGNRRHAHELGLSRRGEEHWASRLTADQVREIRVLLRAGYSQRAIGRRFGVSNVNISNIAHRRIWTHVA